MYTKQELEQMDVTQLMDIASQLGVKVSQNDELETVIYDILDKAAIDSAANETVAPKRKRTRIAKKDQPEGQDGRGPVAIFRPSRRWGKGIGSTSQGGRPAGSLPQAPWPEVEGRAGGYCCR